MTRPQELLWDDWSAAGSAGRSEAEAECAGIMFGLGRPGPAKLRTNRPWVARRLVTKLWPLTSWAGRGSARLTVGGAQSRFVTIALPFELRTGKPDGDGELWPWLRGLFGSCGNLYLPRTSYYLSFRPPAARGAGFEETLALTGLGWKRRNSGGDAPGVFLLRNQEDIVTFMCNIGLNNMALKLEDRAMLRGARENANRVSNCDTANIRRSVAAAREQLRLASRLANDGVLSRLPPPLRAIVEARLANPEATLAEIGEKLSPPIRKSTVKYRWTRLSGYLK